MVVKQIEYTQEIKDAVEKPIQERTEFFTKNLNAKERQDYMVALVRQFNLTLSANEVKHISKERGAEEKAFALKARKQVLSLIDLISLLEIKSKEKQNYVSN